MSNNWPNVTNRPRRRNTYTLASLPIIILLALAADWLREWNIRRENGAFLGEIAEVQPQAAHIFEQFVAEIEQTTDWKVCVNSGLRSEEEQAELKQRNSKNASAERSKHVKGKALDINLYRKKWIGREWLLKSDSKSDWIQTGVVEIAQKYGLKWGGNFKTYHDPVHFEVVE